MTSPIIVQHGWPFEEVSETRYDSIGIADLSTVNDTGRRVGKHNFAVDCSALNEEAGGFQNTTLSAPMSQTTFSLWIWFSSDVPWTENTLIAQRSYEDAAWAIKIQEGQLIFETSDSSLFHWISVPAPTIQKDHLVGISYNAITREKNLYLDGALVTSGISPVAILSNIDISFASELEGNRPFNGYLDSCFITNEIISATDWDWIWNNGFGRDTLDFLDVSIIGKNRCIFRNKITKITRADIKRFIYKNKVETLRGIKADIKRFIYKNKVETLRGIKNDN